MNGINKHLVLTKYLVFNTLISVVGAWLCSWCLSETLQLVECHWFYFTDEKTKVKYATIFRSHSILVTGLMVGQDIVQSPEMPSLCTSAPWKQNDEKGQWAEKYNGCFGAPITSETNPFCYISSTCPQGSIFSIFKTQLC